MQALAKDASASPVEVRNLHKRYGKGVWANDGISFAAVGGETSASSAPTAPARPR